GEHGRGVWTIDGRAAGNQDPERGHEPGAERDGQVDAPCERPCGEHRRAGGGGPVCADDAGGGGGGGGGGCRGGGGGGGARGGWAMILCLLGLPWAGALPGLGVQGIFAPYADMVWAIDAKAVGLGGAGAPLGLLMQWVIAPLAGMFAAMGVAIWFRAGVER